MEDEIKLFLGSSKFKKLGYSSSGCISTGNAYEIDNGKVFIKNNSKSGSEIMFKGEYYGLKALNESGIACPKPILYGNNFVVMEYILMESLRKFTETLGINLAKLHRGELAEDSHIGNNKPRVDKFGFEVTTCCGFLPLVNDWNEDWVTFYTTQRLKPQVDMIEQEYGDREIGELWSQLQRKIPVLFRDILVFPSLLHGDLWSGNAAETEAGPIIYDPAAFYGHDEFDLAIAKMFGGFGSKFFSAYHNIIPQRPGFNERQKLYILFHQLNHWNHFGGGYKSASLNTMRDLVR